MPSVLSLSLTPLPLFHHLYNDLYTYPSIYTATCTTPPITRCKVKPSIFEFRVTMPLSGFLAWHRAGVVGAGDVAYDVGFYILDRYCRSVGMPLSTVSVEAKE
jgi:hypothetical protein